MTPYVLDTNIITALLRYEAGTVDQMTVATETQAEIFLCPVVFYETLRGLLHRDAQKQMQYFWRYAAVLKWDDFTPADWQRAAHLWAELRKQGRPIADADILIGAYAAERGAIVVTANETHFEPLGVQTENWLK